MAVTKPLSASILSCTIFSCAKTTNTSRPSARMMRLIFTFTTLTVQLMAGRCRSCWRTHAIENAHACGGGGWRGTRKYLLRRTGACAGDVCFAGPETFARATNAFGGPGPLTKILVIPAPPPAASATAEHRSAPQQGYRCGDPVPHDVVRPYRAHRGDAIIRKAICCR